MSRENLEISKRFSRVRQNSYWLCSRRYLNCQDSMSTSHKALAPRGTSCMPVENGAGPLFSSHSTTIVGITKITGERRTRSSRYVITLSLPSYKHVCMYWLVVYIKAPAWRFIPYPLSLLESRCRGWYLMYSSFAHIVSLSNIVRRVTIYTRILPPLLFFFSLSLSLSLSFSLGLLKPCEIIETVIHRKPANPPTTAIYSLSRLTLVHPLRPSHILLRLTTSFSFSLLYPRLCFFLLFV